MIFSASSTNKSIKRRIILHWFRHGDLRLYDNQALTHSSHLAQPTYSDDHSMIMSHHHIVPPVVIPIFIFHEKIFGTRNRTPAGTLKCGVKRAQFILESVQNLRHNLQTLVGSKLLVATGDPCQTIDSVLTQLQKYYLQKEGMTDPLNDNITDNNNNEEHQSVQLDLEIVCQKEYTTEEREVLIDMTLLLQKYTHHIDDDEEHHTHITTGSLLQHQLHQPMKRQIQEIWGSTLYLQNRAPFDPICKLLPNGYRKFSARLMRWGKMDLEHILPVPEHLPFPHRFDCHDMTTYLPTLSDLGYTPQEINEGLAVDPRCTTVFLGGETAALQKCHDYIFTQNLLHNTNKTCRQASTLMQRQSSQLSPYLAHGCISPRLIAAEAKRSRINKAEYHLYMALTRRALIQRDYCRYYTVKHGKYIFLREGPVQPKRMNTKRLKNLRIESDFVAWTTGQTGYPLIDAAMRELNATGWIQDKCRLVVASFLFADLSHDWTRGADYFESQLIDYNVYCNWVNWCVATGLNTGQPYTRYVPHNVGNKYDPEGEYVKLWVPELKDVPKEFIHKPWKMSEEEQVQCNARLGIDYPHPIRDPTIGDDRREYRYLRRLGRAIPRDLKRRVKAVMKKDAEMYEWNKKGYVDNEVHGEGGDSDDRTLEVNRVETESSANLNSKERSSTLNTTASGILNRDFLMNSPDVEQDLERDNHRIGQTNR